MSEITDGTRDTLFHSITYITTVIDGIRTYISPQTKITQTMGCGITGTDKSGFAEAVLVAKGAEVAIILVGEQYDIDGEANDVASLDLSGVQEDLSCSVREYCS